MIDALTEELLTLAKAARSVPGGPIHVSTIHRWHQKGVKGVRLETVLRGGIRFTSRQALDRFFVATTAAADGLSAPPRTAACRRRDIAAANRELARAGI